MLSTSRRLFVLACLCGLGAAFSAPCVAQQADGGSWRDKQEDLFDLVNVYEAWDVTEGDPDLLIGVIDNGYDFFHPSLEGKLLSGCYFPGGFHTEFYENIAHGTVICGLMVANPQAGEGVSGLAPQCRVLTASQGMIEHVMWKLQKEVAKANPGMGQLELMQKVVSEHAAEVQEFGKRWVEYQFSGAADAIHYLVDRGVKVINFSGGVRKSACPSVEVWERIAGAFAYAAEKDVVMVLAAGNDGREYDDYPGDPETMLVVGASLKNDTRWAQEATKEIPVAQGSSYGRRLSVMAPVQDIVVCEPHDKRVYSCNGGPMGDCEVPFKGPYSVQPIGATSCAAPVVSALVALIRSARPDLGVRDVVQIVLEGCDDIGEPGPDLYTGHGRVNFAASMSLAQARPK
ncbi:MAG: S8 family serine peptidase [Planctomycetota bacterium]